MGSLSLKLAGAHCGAPTAGCRRAAPLRAQTLGEFWRTHRDRWHEFKGRFTEEQLGILTDLLISPSYYA